MPTSAGYTETSKEVCSVTPREWIAWLGGISCAAVFFTVELVPWYDQVLNTFDSLMWESISCLVVGPYFAGCDAFKRRKHDPLFSRRRAKISGSLVGLR